MQWPRPTRSKTRYKNLRSVFAGEPDDLVSHVLTLAVLFEDLRLELTHFDGDAKHEHNVYFLRRSVATLREFADCIRRTNGLATFETIRRRFTKLQRSEWNRSVAFLKEHKERIDDERNIYGAHVSQGAIQKAMRAFPYGETSSMEIHWVEAAGTERIGPTFRFTGDLMTRVFLSGKHDDDQDEVEYYRSLITLMSDGFTHATTCVALITDQYLGPLFGFGAS